MNKKYIDPEQYYGNRYKQNKSTHPRFRAYWYDIILFTTNF